MKALWKSLSSDEAPVAFEAMCELTAEPERSLPRIKKHLLPVPVIPVERLNELATDLDCDEFHTREKSTKVLVDLGDAAEPFLRRRLIDGSLSVEAGDRVRKILKSLEHSPNRVMRSRALVVLEQMDTPSAREYLAVLGKGLADAWLTKEAQAGLLRVRKR